MNVYITYGMDGYNDQIVDRVFSSMDKACEYVIQHHFSDISHYSKMTVDQLHAEARKHVHEYTVE